jgi:hypothetical protein
MDQLPVVVKVGSDELPLPDWFSSTCGAGGAVVVGGGRVVVVGGGAGAAVVAGLGGAVVVVGLGWVVVVGACVVVVTGGVALAVLGGLTALPMLPMTNRTMNTPRIVHQTGWRRHLATRRSLVDAGASGGTIGGGGGVWGSGGRKSG